ncbi:MAG: amphi-Trp domain-containing protein [Alphaproteobacteria bacterium]|nr:amphi-Trp domain-containing protein [Alphaproteobacteria bacterium]NCQ89061.1 amphi-Trp domain-containing protein [Alphaproteobacteria bacterium]NCT07961.1 amphi-Trp domain-containing protein [Alphaproteobacteria bacterium]
MSKENRDIEKEYTNEQFVAKLRRLADDIEAGENFEIQVAGERIYVPDRAKYSIEHERGDGEEELEFQVKWKIEG